MPVYSQSLCEDKNSFKRKSRTPSSRNSRMDSKSPSASFNNESLARTPHFLDSLRERGMSKAENKTANHSGLTVLFYSRAEEPTRQFVVR